MARCNNALQSRLASLPCTPTLNACTIMTGRHGAIVLANRHRYLHTHSRYLQYHHTHTHAALFAVRQQRRLSPSPVVWQLILLRIPLFKCCHTTPAILLQTCITSAPKSSERPLIPSKVIVRPGNRHVRKNYRSCKFFFMQKVGPFDI